MNYEFAVELLSFFALVTFLLFYLTSTFTHWKIRSVNGPQPIPIFGNFEKVLLGWTSVENYLNEVYERYAKERMVGLFSGFEPLLLLKDVDLIKDVIGKDSSNFINSGASKHEKVDAFASSLFKMGSEKWCSFNNKVSTIFHSDMLKYMFRTLLNCAQQFEYDLDSVQSESEAVDCGKLMRKFTANVISTCVFGFGIKKTNEGDAKILQTSRKIIQPSLKKYLGNKIKELPWLSDIIGHYFTEKDASRFFTNTIDQILKFRERNNVVKPDFLDLTLTLQKNRESESDRDLADKVFVAQTVLFFVSGIHSSSKIISNALRELAENETIQKKLREEIQCELRKNGGVIDYENLRDMSYLDKVLKETLRKYPAVAYFTRKSARNYRFTGTKVVIPNGQKVLIPIHAIHRDPNIYLRPEVFDPERFRNEDFESANPMFYLPFGDGSRNCIGIEFGISQMKLALIKILSNYKLAPCPSVPASMPQNGIFVKMAKLE